MVPDKPEDLLSYEQALLHGLFRGQATLRMAHITSLDAPVLDLVRAGIARDALDARRLRAGIGRRFAVTQGQRRRHDQKPGQRIRLGEELLAEIKNFKRDLRALAAVGDMRTLARFASYAMIFGLAAQLPVRDLARDQLSDEAVPPKKTTEFADCWLKAWGSWGSRMTWDPYGTHPDLGEDR
jgi:hypothetical protein